MQAAPPQPASAPKAGPGPLRRLLATQQAGLVLVILALGTAREMAFTLLGVSWILIAGCIGLLIARRLVPMVEEHLQDGD